MDSEFHSSLRSVSTIFPKIQEEVSGKDVVDYGCGRGILSLDLSEVARLVYAVDIRPHPEAFSGRPNIISGYPEIVPPRSADFVLSLNAFEHYSDPKKILLHWRRILKPTGRVYLSFGPPWYHPYGAHLEYLTRLPWIQLWCPEPLVMAWRSRHRTDGAKRYQEVEGGLNQMSLRKCDKLLIETGFRITSSRTVPIKGFAWPLRFGFGRELWTARADYILSLEADWRQAS